jgi:carboxylesterase type B
MRCLAVAVFTTLISLGQTQDSSGLTVQTQQGSVSGTLVIPQVRRFLGIPYAVANRWEAPELPPTRATTFSATSFGDSCIQTLSAINLESLKLIGLASQRVQESEDCLSLNIWTPSKNRKQSTAVMMWIYGGSFAFGTVRYL